VNCALESGSNPRMLEHLTCKKKEDLTPEERDILALPYPSAPTGRRRKSWEHLEANENILRRLKGE